MDMSGVEEARWRTRANVVKGVSKDIYKIVSVTRYSRSDVRLVSILVREKKILVKRTYLVTKVFF